MTELSAQEAIEKYHKTEYYIEEKRWRDKHPRQLGAMIYALVDPRDQRVRYVGHTTNKIRRLREHIGKKGDNWRKDDWIDELLEEGLIPQFRILEEVSTLDAKNREYAWIRKGRRNYGWKLYNATGPY